ncbi:MAG TPA: hypothetical protein VFN65_14605 [Solirubrobacteraceae bacterium]|nr:hypothetical protein [Solirubrobacteraceae bacterium]
MPRMPVRVLVLAGDGRPAAALVTALGEQRARAVDALLLRRARAWAEDAFGAGAVEVVAERSPGVAVQEGEGGAPSGRPAGETVVAISPDLPVWRPELATALLGDLRAGCPLSLAPVFDGGLYLLALADASAPIAGALTGLDLAGPHGMSGLMALAARAGTEVGLLRAERALRRERDVRALRADPLTDAELRALLAYA